MYYLNNTLYSHFEQTIFDIVSKFLSPGEKITFETNFPSPSLNWDLTLEEGCKNQAWIGKTAIEVKAHIAPRMMEKLYNRARILFDSNTVKQYVVIYKETTHMSHSIKQYIDSVEDKRFKVLSFEALLENAKTLKIIDHDQYDQLKKEDQYSVTDLSIPTSTNRPTQESERSVLESAKNNFSGNNYTLFLGAGVSMDAKLPGWSQLLKGLLVQTENTPFDFINQENATSITEAMGNSNIITGRYVIDAYKRKYGIASHTSDSTLTEKQQNEFNNYEYELQKRIRKTLYKKVGTNSKLISAIANAMKKNHLNKSLHIITMNY